MLIRASQAIVESRFIPASDGLSLHVRCYLPDIPAAGLPVLCLPGLTRNEADFEPLARHLCADPLSPRAVYALDSRGRGRSADDPDWRNYNPAVELGDVVTVMAALDLGHAVFVGTSRGGILTMLLAASQPELIAGAILNDIGPVIEAAGLLRIKGYVGRTQQPKDMDDAAKILRGLFADQFPRLTNRDWHAWALRNWRQDGDRLVPRYDQRLAETLTEIAPDQPVPALWDPFAALPLVPLMVIRGAHSDILSAETVDAMRAVRPDLEAVEIPDQGHAPLLDREPELGRISAFMRRCDRAAGR